MEYSVTWKDGCGCTEVEYFTAETPEEAVAMAMDARKEMCEDPYGIDFEEYGFSNMEEWLESIHYTEFDDGFHVLYGNEHIDTFYSFRAEVSGRW